MDWLDPDYNPTFGEHLSSTPSKVTAEALNATFLISPGKGNTHKLPETSKITVNVQHATLKMASHICPFCNDVVTNHFPRHCETRHKNEEEVIIAMS